MLQPIAVGHKSLADYTHLAGKPLIEEIRELAEELEGLKVLHLSATAFGGGVSEILYTLVPLMNDVGIEAEWQVMLGREEFYNVTKLLHNALQGNPDSLSEEEWQIFERYNELNATEISSGWDVIIVHDPQPAGDPPARAGEGQPLDLALPHRPVHAQPGRDRAPGAARARVRRHASSTCRTTCPPGMDGDGAACTSARPRSTRSRPRTWRSPPRTPRSCATSSASTWTARCMCQVSRFDPWKDPMGVIDAYRVGEGGDARGAAGAGGLDGHRRPRGLGVLQLDDGLRRRRPRHPHPQQPQQRRRDRGERVPVAGRRGDPEVHARGLRPHRLRGALEGAPVHRRRRGRHPAAGGGRRDRLPRLLPRGVRRALAADPARARPGQAARAAAARSTCAGTSSRPACCATGCVSSKSDDLRDPARPRLEPRPRHVRAGRGRQRRPAPRRRRPGDRAHRPRAPPRRAVDRLRDDRRGRRGQPPARRRQLRLRARRGAPTGSGSWSPTPRPTTTSTTWWPTRCCGSSSTTSGTSRTRPTSAGRRSRPTSRATAG